MTNTRTLRRLIRHQGGYEVTENGLTITQELQPFPVAFDILRETGDYHPTFFDAYHRKHGDILEDILHAGYGLHGFKVLGKVPFPFSQED